MSFLVRTKKDRYNLMASPLVYISYISEASGGKGIVCWIFNSANLSKRKKTTKKMVKSRKFYKGEQI